MRWSVASAVSSLHAEREGEEKGHGEARSTTALPGVVVRNCLRKSKLSCSCLGRQSRVAALLLSPLSVPLNSFALQRQHHPALKHHDHDGTAMGSVTVPPTSWSNLVSVDKPDAIRHLNIHHNSQSIKGSFAISPLAEDVYPPLYDMPKEASTKNNTSSATFETKNSAIGVTVWIIGEDPVVRKTSEQGKPKGKPVSIEAKSTMGHMKLVIVSQSSSSSMAEIKSACIEIVFAQPQYFNPLPLHISAKSHTGNVHIHLPPTFSGLLRWTCESGQFKPSAGILERYTPVGEQKKHRGVGKIHVADWVLDKSERGDSVELTTTSGSINLYEAGEDSNASACTIT